MGTQPPTDSNQSAQLFVRHFLVEGLVQGVGFRNFVATQAKELKLIGWVRNLKDGRVEVLAAANAKVMHLFEEHLRMGPSTAQVRSVTIVDSGVEVSGDGFTVLPTATKMASRYQ